MNTTPTAESTHPIYAKAAIGEYIRAKDIALLIRAALKKAFPATKFSVRTDSSVRVHWIDGPITKSVDAVIKPFETRDFDGSIDLAHSNSLWIYPDGSAHMAHSRGTTGSMGQASEVIESPRNGKALLLENVASIFVFSSRSISAALLLRGIEIVRAQNWRELEGFDWAQVVISESEHVAPWISSYGSARLGYESLDSVIYKAAYSEAGE